MLNNKKYVNNIITGYPSAECLGLDETETETWELSVRFCHPGHFLHVGGPGSAEPSQSVTTTFIVIQWLEHKGEGLQL